MHGQQRHACRVEISNGRVCNDRGQLTHSLVGQSRAIVSSFHVRSKRSDVIVREMVQLRESDGWARRIEVGGAE